MLRCMRTTVRLDATLLKAAKRYAAEAGVTLTSLIEDGLREVLSRRGARKGRSTFRLPTYQGEGLLPGVDLDDTASLETVMGRDTA
jgi:hypothetical protein